LVSPIDVGLYVHVAFCRTKCHYCDFNTYTGLDRLIGRYVDAVAQEIHDLPPTLPGLAREPLPFTIGSIFLGGGTPSMLSIDQIATLLEAAREWTVEPNAEVTLEANPDDPTVAYLRVLRQLGINRLSFGVQSFDDGLLARLGRRHDARTARTAYDRARSAGFANVSLDLMFALPGQTLDQWLATLGEAIALAPDHLSVYNLTIEEGTRFGALAAKGKLVLPDDDLAADMYEAAIDRLAASGYYQYEISNWASADPSRETRALHNLRYWRNQPYFGVGAGAHSSFAGYRYANLRPPTTYVKRIAARASAVESVERIGTELEMAETMILGLRLNDGVDIEAFRRRFGQSPDEIYPELLQETRELHLVAGVDQRIYLTRRGRLMGNDVFCRFLPPDHSRAD
jgi:oxygen-independent coproporphyrinogen-3 oxidase